MDTLNNIVIPVLPTAIAAKGDMSDGQFRDTVMRCGEAVAIDSVNWRDFPYKPEVKAYIAHDKTRLLCLFVVNEKHLLVKALNDNDPVWQDSCVEMFISDADGQHYYNFEANAVGTLLASRRMCRSDYKRLSPGQLRRITRLSSLPQEVTSVSSDNGVDWSLLLGIPFDLIGFNGVPSELRLNLYKCGDHTATPHYLSLAPIRTSTPDFHRPEFFITMKLEQ